MGHEGHARGRRRQTRFSGILAEHGTLFSEELGIDAGRQPFRWLLASVLFGRRISTTIAQRTYRAFARRRLLNPQAILRLGRDGLIPVMGEGGYVRYDNMTSDYVTEICEKLVREYGGNVGAIDEQAHGPRDLEARLLEFEGIGPVTLGIFLRELRGVWPKADPPLSELAVQGARALGMTRATTAEGARADLERLWKVQRPRGYEFRHLEAALVRIGLARRKRARKDRLSDVEACSEPAGSGSSK